MQEIWKDISNYGGLYEVSNIGKVRRSIKDIPHDGTYPGRILRGIEIRGYRKINLYKNGRSKMFFIHRLVADVFLPKIKGKNFINHIDLNKKNNDVTNLEWCTARENKLHAMKHGAYAFGERAAKAKLNPVKVQKIRQLYATGNYYQRELGKKFGVSQAAIGWVVRKNSWNHIR